MYLQTPTQATDSKPKASTLTPRQRKAATALLTFRTHEEAAEAANVSTSTLSRYLRDADFQAELHRQQDAATADAIRVMSASLTDAVSVLVDIAKDTEEKASSRVNACRILLAEGRAWRDFFELAERLTVLEAAVARGQHG